MLFIFLLFVSAYGSCDEVCRGNLLGKGAQKFVYEGKLGDEDVVIKELQYIDNMEDRFQGYLALYSEYKVFKSFEIDYPYHSMKIYDFCQSNGTFFYIMERGQAVTRDQIHRPALLRMLTRNVKARFKVMATDIKWSQLVSKGDEIYTIDVNMGEIYENLSIDFKEYCRLYTWKLYSNPVHYDEWNRRRENLENEDVNTFLDYARLHQDWEFLFENSAIRNDIDFVDIDFKFLEDIQLKLLKMRIQNEPKNLV